MKSERRHELEKNVLAERLGSGIASVQPMIPLIVGGIAVLAVGSLAWGIYSSYTQRGTARAWTEYYFTLDGGDADSFAKVAENFSDSPAADWARLKAGNDYLLRGVDAIYRNRSEGEKLLNQSIALLEEVDSDKLPELSGRAKFDLGQAHETLGELDKAAKYYQEVVDSASFPSLAQNAQDRLAFVTSEKGKEFYAWFTKLDPKPDAPINLPDNLSLPPGLPDLKFEQPSDEESTETKETESAAPTDKIDPDSLPALPQQGESSANSKKAGEDAPQEPTSQDDTATDNGAEGSDSSGS